ncbi:MAG: type II toxin-antitoxin system RelE/ParE family toxin [Planctomycetes bacterium]|jgi:plasmid stabilization system protein ParE|nr:type II toxin-antitoxin system RelE/ParE family toxin [Planctomycetota bacterium]
MVTPPFTLIWSPKSVLDLDRLHDWITETSPTAANAYLIGLTSKAASLLRHPRRGHPLHESDLPPDNNPFREIHYRNHRIIYTIHEREISIITVIHQRRHFALWMMDP